MCVCSGRVCLYVCVWCPSLANAVQLQQSSAPAWKVHMDAMMGMLSRSGGMTKICRTVRGMCVTMVLYTMCVLFSSPPCPSHPRPPPNQHTMSNLGVQDPRNRKHHQPALHPNP